LRAPRSLGQLASPRRHKVGILPPAHVAPPVNHLPDADAAPNQSVATGVTSISETRFALPARHRRCRRRRGASRDWEGGGQGNARDERSSRRQAGGPAPGRVDAHVRRRTPAATRVRRERRLRATPQRIRSARRDRVRAHGDSRERRVCSDRRRARGRNRKRGDRASGMDEWGERFSTVRFALPNHERSRAAVGARRLAAVGTSRVRTGGRRLDGLDLRCRPRLVARDVHPCRRRRATQAATPHNWRTFPALGASAA
jgi:hypothetical protein